MKKINPNVNPPVDTGSEAPSQQIEGWRERFDETDFMTLKISHLTHQNQLDVVRHEVKVFIEQEISRAKAEATANEVFMESRVAAAKVVAIQEERERLAGLIRENRKGSFTDDAGNDCWYVDDLLKVIEE